MPSKEERTEVVKGAGRRQVFAKSIPRSSNGQFMSYKKSQEGPLVTKSVSKKKTNKQKFNCKTDRLNKENLISGPEFS